jgi:hypothetical protein
MNKSKRRTAWLLASMTASVLSYSARSQAQDEPAPADVATPDQINAEQAYDSQTDAHIRDWIHSDNHATSDEERGAIKEHWSRAARLWRIRNLAQAAGDTATVARVDRALAKADKALERQLRRYREHAPVMTAPPPEAEATEAPPPPQAEVQPPSPSPTAVWLPGYWAWRGSRHAWIGGRWSEPPQPGYAWEAPRWENRGGRWAFIEGRWNAGAPPAPSVVYEPPPPPPTEVVVPEPPPPPRVELRPPPPAPHAVWIAGSWQWSGREHVWVGGRWSAPRPGYAWEPARWEHTQTGWRSVQGHWRR